LKLNRYHVKISSIESNLIAGNSEVSKKEVSLLFCWSAFPDQIFSALPCDTIDALDLLY